MVKKLSQRRRKENFCHYCGALFTEQLKPTKDHLWPRAMGGTNHDFNLVDACKPCNQAKGDNAPALPAIFFVKDNAIHTMQGNRDMNAVQNLATMVAAIAYYLRTKKKPTKAAPK